MELAAKLGVSQSLVSRVERGLQAFASPQEQRLAKLLGASILRRKSVPAAADGTVLEPIEPRPPHSSGSMPLKIVEWQRRRPSGDFAAVIPSRDAVLIVFGDVAGNGPRVASLAHYVNGWLRGAMGRGASMLIAEELDAELRLTAIDLAYFLAIVRREGSDPHSVAIEYMRRGMTAPLLFYHLKSERREHLRALHQERELLIISAPWRIVAASDGLLQRLGSGNESAGMRHLARWQSSEQREQPADSRFSSGSAGSTDESLWIVEWNGWDAIIDLDAAVYEERRRLHRSIRDLVGDDAGAAVAELVGNALRHGSNGRAGTIWVRIRREERATRVEIEDHGTGGLTQETIEVSRNGLAVVRGIASHVSTRNAYPTGTIVTAVFPSGEKS